MTKSIGKSGSTEKLTTHMQVDKIEVDFGFITNAGKNKSSTEIFCLGYDKEEIVASRTLFWVGVEVISDLLVNKFSKKNFFL